MNVVEKSEGLLISDVDFFNPEQIFDCGQCFRFEKCGDAFSGVVSGKVLTIRKVGERAYLINRAKMSDYAFLSSFLSLDCDYDAYRADILETMKKSGIDTSHMEKAMDYGKGIRILRQDKWETLVSFIISQNNNIPRIKKIIETISRRFGESFVSDNGEIHFSFPSAERIFAAGTDEIFDCRTGFRAKYIFDAAEAVVSGRIEPYKLSELTYNEANAKLLTIKGVGPKVAACTLLFGYNRLEAFPIDVWVSRVMAKYYPEGTDKSVFGKYAGLAQQYLFYYERYIADKTEP